jgi:hypothetical protein
MSEDQQVKQEPQFQLLQMSRQILVPFANSKASEYRRKRLFIQPPGISWYDPAACPRRARSELPPR